MTDSVSSPLELRPPIVVERPIGSGTYVRLSDDARKSLVYLGYEKGEGAESEIEAKGTGFLVAAGEPGGTYIVTAAHVALNLEDAPFCVRLNQRYKLSDRDKKPHGRLHHVDARWFYHPTDPTVDVAVMPFQVPEWADFQWLRLQRFISDYRLVSNKIGPGDFSYVVGILPFMKGTKRNMPAVHTGHVVLMEEDEKVTISDWRQRKKTKKEETRFMEIDAYLVQATALPGSSGSPVFVRRSLDTVMSNLPELDGDHFGVSIPGSLWFLGVWRGAWFGDPPKDVYPFFDNDKVPFGVGTVVPAVKVFEVLNHPELHSMRAKALQAQMEKLADVPLEAKEAELTGDEILRAALNTPPVKRKRTRAKGSKRGHGGVNSK